MRTLVISPELFATEGGISRIMRLYVKAIAELGGKDDRVAIVALNDSAEHVECSRLLGYEKICVIKNCERNKWRFSVAAVIESLRSDCVICGHLHQLILPRLVAMFRPALRCCLIAHGIEVWRPYTLLERFALRGTNRIICVSEYTRRQMLRFDVMLDPENLVVVPNTFSPWFYTEAASAKAFVTGSRSPRILVVSRLDSVNPYKGVDTMIEAMSLIVRYLPTAQLRIVGGGGDRHRLEALAAELALGDSIHFCGTVDDTKLSEEYQACDIFALPSRKEGFGLVYLEALSYGKPCIAARAGGATDVVNDDVGTLVEYGDVDQIMLAVIDLIKYPRDLQVMKSRAESFGFQAFKRRLAETLKSASLAPNAVNRE
jgi:phosphatidylinositol alpha-1,6-mannosyltransferase